MGRGGGGVIVFRGQLQWQTVIIIPINNNITIIPIVIGALGSISKGAKTWFGKLDVPDFLGSVQYRTFLELLTCCRKCCVSKLRGVAETQ